MMLVMKVAYVFPCYNIYPKSILKLLRSPKEGAATSRVSIRVAMDTHLHPWNAQPTETRKGERWESNPTGNCLGLRV